MDCPPIPQFCLDFLLLQIGTSHCLSEELVRLVCTYYMVQITQLHSGLH